MFEDRTEQRMLVMLATIFTCVLISAEAFAGSIERTPRMKNSRFDAQATTLTNEKVLITGGNQFRSQPSFPDAEIFDPATATFTSVPNNMSQLRSGHTATLLNDGRVLIAGGEFFFPSSSEIFDSITQTFATPVLMTQQRRGHTATKLGDGRVLVVGGDSSPFDAELYDPIANVWTSTSPTPPFFPHAGHTATLLCDGRVFIAGGSSFSGGTSKRAEIFNPSSGGFTPVSALMTQFRGLHSATLLSCSEILIVGGDNRFPATAEIFNTTSELFTPITATNGPRNPRNDHIAALLDNGDVLFSGGGGGIDLEVFRAATRTFERETLSFFSSILFTQGSAAAAYQSTGNCPTCASGHKILVVGGKACTFDGSISGFQDTFVYVPTDMSPPPPSITSVTPATAGTGGGATVTITGANFQTGAFVSVGSALTVTSITPTQIVGTTTARSAGTASASVNNPDSQIGSLASAFTYVFRPPGDANGDSTLSVGDIFYMINHLFAGGPPPIN